MVISRGRWSSASTSMLSGVRVPQGDNLRLALLRSNRVTSGLPMTRPEASYPLHID
jgi:hypothetical protein